MTPVQELLDHIETGSAATLLTHLQALHPDDKRTIARHLPAHLSERTRAGFEAQQRVRGLAPLYRLAGAACLGGAEQVAGWLDRRELRQVEPVADVARMLAVLGDRPQEWRRNLAVRLVERLRPGTGSTWRRIEALGNWDLAAALVAETGAEPPENDAFVAGWVLRRAEQQRRDRSRVLADDPLLDHMLPRLFQAQGVADGLLWDREWGEDRTVLGQLAGLAATGRVPRRLLLDGCVSRFLAGVEAAEAAPFIMLWQQLEPAVAEIPVTDFVRMIPSAPSPVVQLALEELRRAEPALDGELFAEAVQALAFRPEKKYMTAALQWVAAAPPSRGALAVAALAPVFTVDTPALRERAVRLAIQLAPHAAEPGREAIREAAVRLPADLRERVAAGYGAVQELQPEPVTAATLTATPLPALAPPITSVGELAAALAEPLWPEVPAHFERVLAALVTLTHQDRDAVVAALQPWWRASWRHPFDASMIAFGISGFDEDIRFLLMRCALAVVSPADGRVLTETLNENSRRWPSSEPAPQRFVQRRFREVMDLLERGGTIPLLLATPTSPTGHVDAATLVERMEVLGETEPLESDFLQALLRLPRDLDPELVVRAEKLPSRAGRRLAACLRDGGLPEPTVTWELLAFDRPAYYQQSLHEAHARLTPPEGTTGQLAELWTLHPEPHYPSFSRHMVWWPPTMPSHREAVAAHVLACLPWVMDSTDGQVEVVAALAHTGGPAGIATASTLVIGMGHQLPAQRAFAADAIITLAAYGGLPAADLGRAVGHLVRGEQVKLNRVTGVLDEVTSAGAHAEVWAALAEAVPLLLPAPGEKARAGLGELLKVAVRAAELTGARGELPGLADVAARKGSSQLLHQARRLHEVIAG
ncbi:DUF7824 domain-containing protein [Nonomuraea gerenzanensis]|uniref:Secreted protein n=1 Tax=Nonomuraea gerenzanensis TaxID=93944 RepID=A0A1M4EDN4_9ACTN|nr:DUF6493 family protein [Nonomuraea gerenzanensis]UBU08535.1 DUF6493 family protein [Nonomuraea gerenzanensis]SBO96884.1 secreted protein [Nonomuraea gerenzanensis]